MNEIYSFSSKHSQPLEAAPGTRYPEEMSKQLSQEVFDSAVLKIPFMSLQENRNLLNMPVSAQLFVGSHSEDTIGKLVKVSRHFADQEMIYLNAKDTQRVLGRYETFLSRGAPVVPSEHLIMSFLAYSASVGNSVLVASELSTQEFE